MELTQNNLQAPEMLQSTPTASPQTISTNLLNQASSNVVKNPSGSPNRLLYKSP